MQTPLFTTGTRISLVSCWMNVIWVPTTNSTWESSSRLGWSHDWVVSEWSDYQDNCSSPEKDPRNRYLLPLKTIKFDIFDAGAGSNVGLDAGLAHPWNMDILFQSAQADGAVAKRNEDRKNKKMQKTSSRSIIMLYSVSFRTFWPVGYFIEVSKTILCNCVRHPFGSLRN